MQLPEIHRPPSFEPEEWERHRRGARAIIWERVLAGQLDIHHGYLAGRLGLYHFAGNYFSVLDAVCVEELAAEGPMVTVLVTAAGSDVPSGRFFELAERCEIDVNNPSAFARAQRQASIDWIRAHPERADHRLGR